MAYPLAALAIRPSSVDPIGVLQTAASLQGQQTQNQLAGLRMAEMQEQMRESRDRRGALEQFRTQGGMANPAALTTLSGHPDIYTQAAGAMNTRQQAQVLRNAQAAREVMLSTREGTPERAQAFQRELDRALQEGRIDQDTHQRYASQPASNLFLQNLVSLATPISDKLSTRELFGMFGFGPDGAESAATAPPVRPQAAAGPMPFAPSAPIATGRVALSPNAAVTPPAQAPADVPGVLVDNTTAPTTTAPMPAFAPDTTGAAPPATPAAGPPPRLSLRELVARGTDAQRQSIKLLLATGKLDDVAKILREIESGNVPDAIRTQGIKADQAYTNLTTALDGYQRLIQQTGAEAWHGQNMHALEQSRRNIQLQLKELFNLGVLNGPDLALMESMIFDPTVGVQGIGPGGVIPAPRNFSNVLSAAGMGPSINERAAASIDSLKEMLRGIRNTQTRAIGLPPVGPATSIPDAAVAALRSAPNRAADFDAKYGTPQNPNPSRTYLQSR